MNVQNERTCTTLTNGDWTTSTEDLTTDRSFHSSGSINDEIILFGGSTRFEFSKFIITQKYNPYQLQFSSLTSEVINSGGDTRSSFALRYDAQYVIK